MTRPELSQMTPEEKDALILALLKRIEDLEAPGRAAENPGQLQRSTVPRAETHPAAAPEARWRRHDTKAGPKPRPRGGLSYRRLRALWQGHPGGSARPLRQAYDHINLPPMRPLVTRVRLFGCRCPNCRRRAREGVGASAAGDRAASRPGCAFIAYERHQRHWVATGVELLGRSCCVLRPAIVSLSLQLLPAMGSGASLPRRPRHIRHWPDE